MKKFTMKLRVILTVIALCVYYGLIKVATPIEQVMVQNPAIVQQMDNTDQSYVAVQLVGRGGYASWVLTLGLGLVLYVVWKGAVKK